MPAYSVFLYLGDGCVVCLPRLSARLFSEDLADAVTKPAGRAAGQAIQFLCATPLEFCFARTGAKASKNRVAVQGVAVDQDPIKKPVEALFDVSSVGAVYMVLYDRASGLEMTPQEVTPLPVREKRSLRVGFTMQVHIINDVIKLLCLPAHPVPGISNGEFGMAVGQGEMTLGDLQMNGIQLNPDDSLDVLQGVQLMDNRSSADSEDQRVLYRPVRGQGGQAEQVPDGTGKQVAWVVLGVESTVGVESYRLSRGANFVAHSRSGFFESNRH